MSSPIYTQVEFNQLYELFLGPEPFLERDIWTLKNETEDRMLDRIDSDTLTRTVRILKAGK